MYHSMTIGDKHTFRDFGLIPTSKPVISSPSPNLSFLDIPGTNGSLDITEAISGIVTYANRKGNFEFYVQNEMDKQKVYEDILSYLHGQRMSLVFDDDNKYFYVGRFSVNQMKSEMKNAYVVIDYQVNPFKYEFTDIKTVPWTVSDETEKGGWQVHTLPVTTSAAVTISPKGDMPITPVLWVESITGELNVTASGKKYTLVKGKNRIPQLMIRNKAVSLSFVGTGMVHIYMKWGWL